MTCAQSPRVAFLSLHSQSYLVLVRGQLLRPHYDELDAALAKKYGDDVLRFQFVANRAQPRARRREIKRMRKQFKDVP